MTPGVGDEIFVRILSAGDGFAPEKVHFVTDKGKELWATALCKTSFLFMRLENSNFSCNFATSLTHKFICFVIYDNSGDKTKTKRDNRK
jgi:hypothetical protein